MMNNNTLTIRNVQIDFPLGSFFRKNITQYRDGRDVVWPEVTLPFAKNDKFREKACLIPNRLQHNYPLNVFNVDITKHKKNIYRGIRQDIKLNNPLSVIL